MEFNSGNESDRFCFVCGADNPHGFKLVFQYPPNMAYATLEFDDKYQGWSGIVHGGLISTLLDEAMAQAVCKHVGRAVTASINVRFRQPLPIGKRVIASGEVISAKRKLIEARAQLKFEDGGIVAEASGKFMRID